jgi:hypothetical protein
MNKFSESEIKEEIPKKTPTENITEEALVPEFKFSELNEFNHTLWYHNPNNPDTSKDSYIKIYQLRNSYQLIGMHQSLISSTHNKLLLTGAFYLMKDGILPMVKSDIYLFLEYKYISPELNSINKNIIIIIV